MWCFLKETGRDSVEWKRGQGESTCTFNINDVKKIHYMHMNLNVERQMPSLSALKMWAD